MKSRMNLHRKIAILGKDDESRLTLFENIINASNFNLNETNIYLWDSQ